MGTQHQALLEAMVSDSVHSIDALCSEMIVSACKNGREPAREGRCVQETGQKKRL